MVDTRVVVPGLIDSTRVLTFTPDEAVKWHYAEGKAESISEVMSRLGVADYTIKEYAPTWLDHLIGFFTNPAKNSIPSILKFRITVNGMAQKWGLQSFWESIFISVNKNTK